MDVREETAGDVTVMNVAGRIDSTTAPELGRALAEALSAARNRLVLDLRATDYLSSAGLRVLLLASKQINEARGKFVLCALNDRVKEVLQVSGFDSILTLCAGRDEALALAAK
jgi:anti-anti-sigma factor